MSSNDPRQSVGVRGVRLAASRGDGSRLRVAVAKTSPLPDVIGEAAAYFDPLEVEDIAQAIFPVLDAPEFRAKLVELGRTRSREFSWQKTAEATRRVYKEARELGHRSL